MRSHQANRLFSFTYRNHALLETVIVNVRIGTFLSCTHAYFSFHAGKYHHLAGRFLTTGRTATARYHSLWGTRQHGDIDPLLHDFMMFTAH